MKLKVKTNSGIIFDIDDNCQIYGYDKDGNYHSCITTDLELALPEKEIDKPEKELNEKLQNRLLDIIEIQARR